MAKTTISTQFRKVDIDQFDENNYQEEADQADQQQQQQGPPDEKEVTNLLSSNKNVDALKLVLKNAPIGSKNQQVKEKTLQLVLRVLTSFKSSEIEKGITALEPEAIDLLMKYIYKGFEVPTDGSSGVLLTWHEKAYAVRGVGCIVRVLTDRKRV